MELKLAGQFPNPELPTPRADRTDRKYPKPTPEEFEEWTRLLAEYKPLRGPSRSERQQNGQTEPTR